MASGRETLTGLLDLAQAAFTGNDSGAAPVLLMLGRFKFSLNTAVFDEIGRTTEYSWGAVPRFGRLDALQYTGPGVDAITLPGVIYPDWRGDDASLDNLRTMAAEGKPQALVDGFGRVLGKWVVERVEERQSVFKPDSTPRRIEFVVALRKYSDAADLSN